MRYLQTYTQHNEGLKSGIAAAGLVGSLLTGSPDIKGQNINDISIVDDNKLTTSKNNVKELSLIRKKSENKDIELSNILFEIEKNVNGDSTKFVQLFEKLSTHIETKYGYKIESKNVEELSASGSDVPKDLTVFEILGWLGSICLAICGIPQAWQSYKDKNSDGISWGFILLWAFGEVFALAYVYDKLDLPLVLNYATNILILGVILYYKIKPTIPENGNLEGSGN